jgi:malate dehydrogenase
MFAARQSFNLFQKRAFSASASQVPFPAPSPYWPTTLANNPQASKVAVLGAGGGIGQPLSLLMKLNPRVTDLALYDIKGGPGTIMPIVRSADGY